MQPAIRWYLSLSVAAVLSFALLQMLQPSHSWAKEDEDEDDKVHDLMEKVHEGKKSPWKKGEAAAKQNPVDWATIKAALPRLQEMSKALQGAKSKEVRETPILMWEQSITSRRASPNKMPLSYGKVLTRSRIPAPIVITKVAPR